MSQIPAFTATESMGERRLQDPSKPAPQRKKRVVITGGSGKLGRWVVREMVEHGWEVFNCDIQAPAASEADVDARFFQTDWTDYGQVIACLMEVDAAVKGVDAIIHLSAIPAPGKGPNQVVFQTNIMQTYNILEAARVVGIKNIALASSETVFGIPLFPTLPDSFPLTEEPQRPESSYSLSKWLGEKMSEQYARWDPEVKIINIRLSNVMAPSDYAGFPKWQDDPWSRAWNGFCYIDARDCGQAFRKALESNLKGTHVFNIANADTCFNKPTAELAKTVFPNVPYKPDTDNPREGLISIKKAREVLGYEPKYDWQSEVKKLGTSK